MPKGKWSAKDERKYEAILKSCKLHTGRKKGATKTCKRIAAATVNRDIALAGLGGIDDDEKRWPGITQRKAEGALRDRTVRRLWDDYEQKKSAWERAAKRWDAEGTDDARAAKRMAMDELVDAERRLHNWRYHGKLGGLRGAVPALGALGAQLLSVRLGSGRRREPAAYAVWNNATHKWRRFENREDAAAFARKKNETVEPLYRYKVHHTSRFDDPGEVKRPSVHVAFDPEDAENKFYDSFLEPGEAESVDVTKVELAGAWRSGERELKSGALLREQGGRMALLSDADDPLAPPGRGDVLLSVREGDDEIFSDYFPSIEEANAVLRSKGFRGTPREHREAAQRYLTAASNNQQYGNYRDALYDAGMARAESQWADGGSIDLELSSRAGDAAAAAWPRLREK